MFGKKINVLLVTMLFTFASFLFASSNALAINQKDSDLDGISDEAETKIYKTNPLVPDSAEVLFPKDLDDEVALIDANTPIAWYIARISGIASFVLFTLVICMGLFMSTKLSLKFMRFIMPASALESHSFTATYLAFGFLIFHVVSLMFDSFIILKPIEIFVPFLLKRDLTTSIGVNINIPIALGVIALYLALILITTSHLRGKILNTKIWRKIHYSSFLFYILFLIHGISAGTDTKEPWMIAIYASSGIAVIGLLALRIKISVNKGVLRRALENKDLDIGLKTEASP